MVMTRRSETLRFKRAHCNLARVFGDVSREGRLALDGAMRVSVCKGISVRSFVIARHTQNPGHTWKQTKIGRHLAHLFGGNSYTALRWSPRLLCLLSVVEGTARETMAKSSSL